jgi:3',5'-nucleoside bisphosphate phosphatase
VTRVDLHLHTNASDGEDPPAELVRRARAAGLDAIAITDHDTLAGLPAALAAAGAAGVRVIPGCEFSVQGPGGELHLLAYLLPLDDPSLESFLAEQREGRRRRLTRIVARLQALGVPISEEAVCRVAGHQAIGRPHVARALVAGRWVQDVAEAFERYLGFGRAAFVPKELPSVEAVVAEVRRAGGVTSMAHLKDRGQRPAVAALRAAGVDALEVLHPAHDERTRRRLGQLADDLGMLKTGGSDWHGEQLLDDHRAAPGALPVPAEWLAALERLRAQRLAQGGT